MARIRTAAVAMIFVWITGGLPAGEQRNDRDKPIIAWPNERHQTLQAAIDAAPDGATIAIGRGRHETPAVVIRGRHLTIEGAGSGRKRDGKIHTGGVSALVGPAPRPVTQDGRVILPMEDAIAQLQIIGGSVAIRDLALSGFDAGISIRDDDRATIPARVRVEDVVIGNTGRGVWSSSSGGLTIEHTTIQETLWNGVSFAPSVLQALHHLFYLNAASFFSTGFAGVLIGPNGYAIISNTQVGNCFGPGIVVQGNAAILDNVITGNQGGGILLDKAKNNPLVRGNTITSNHIFGVGVQGATGTPVIQENQIASTQPDSTALFGDGIVVVLSETWVTANTVTSSSRAGLSTFGGMVHLGDNLFVCSGFDLEGEPYFGQNFTVDNQNGNLCGCPVPTPSCVIQSIGLAPPPGLPPVQ